MTQTSASVTSRIWLAVRRMMFAKIDVWFSSRKVQKAIANTRPKYFARSPVSMRNATKFMSPSPWSDARIDHARPTARLQSGNSWGVPLHLLRQQYVAGHIMTPKRGEWFTAASAHFMIMIIFRRETGAQPNEHKSRTLRKIVAEIERT